jgi:ArsR family transcriptional regulator
MVRQPASGVQTYGSGRLEVLASAGLLDRERGGTWVYYWAIPAALQQLSGILRVVEGEPAASPECAL